MSNRISELEDQNEALSVQLTKGVDLMVKVAGQLAEYQQKLRDLVEASWAVHAINTTPKEKQRAYDALVAARELLDRTPTEDANAN